EALGVLRKLLRFALRDDSRKALVEAHASANGAAVRERDRDAGVHAPVPDVDSAGSFSSHGAPNRKAPALSGAGLVGVLCAYCSALFLCFERSRSRCAAMQSEMSLHRCLNLRSVVSPVA